MSQANQSMNDKQTDQLSEENKDRATLELDKLIYQCQIESKAEHEEFLFESLNCGDLLTPTSSQQTTICLSNSQTTDDLNDQFTCEQNSNLGYNQFIYPKSNHFQSTYSLSTYSQNDQMFCIQDNQLGHLDKWLIGQSNVEKTDLDSDNLIPRLSSQSISETDSSLPSSQSTNHQFSYQQSNGSFSVQNYQQNHNRLLFESDKMFKKTIMIRLEILMKVLYGKGLFFNDRILVAKKCWENANFEGLIKMMKYQGNNTLIYQKITKANRIALLMMSAKIYLLLAEDRVTSRRQIYYEEKNLFTPCKCYELIEQVCAFVNLSRRELNIIACGKGLVAGDLVLLFENSTVIDVSQFKKGCLIPDSLIYLSGLVTNAKYALVIEKDATFSKLIDAGFHLMQKVILITSKGFPDVYTRELVNILSSRFSIKTFGLFDCDPFGIDIFCCFKFGSVNLIHHSAQISCPKIVWLGIYPTEIAFLKLKNVKLTQTDERRLNSLLKRVYLNQDQFLHNELAILKQIKVKSGLQDLGSTIFDFILCKIDHFLAFY